VLLSTLQLTLPFASASQVMICTTGYLQMSLAATCQAIGRCHRWALANSTCHIL
jgi:hypothetical protein